MNRPRYNFKDLTGKRFGCIKVEAKLEEKTKSRGVLWLCSCECGNEIKLPSNSLTSGNTKSCGDLRQHPRPSDKLNDIPLAYLNAVKQNATKRNLPYEITASYIWEIFEKQSRTCALSGVPLSFLDGARVTQGFSASLDRIDNNLGYIVGNVRWVHKDINRMRWQCNDDVFLEWCKKCIDKKQQDSPRLSWYQYALALAKTAALRSEDPYKKVGACVLRADKSVAGLGYNGAPRNVEIDWSNRDERRKRVIHAEVNALSYCRPGEGWILASTLLPCRNCLQVIAAYGIKAVIYGEVYAQDDLTLTLAKEFGIELIQL